MLQKYPEGMLDRFVTSSSLRLQKTENGIDNQVCAVQREEEGNYSVHSDDYLYWMYFSIPASHILRVFPRKSIWLLMLVRQL